MTRKLVHVSCTALALILISANLAVAADGATFNRDNPLFEVPSQKALDLTQEVTLEAWIQADAMPVGGGRILDKSAPGTQLGYMLDTHPGNSLRFLNAKGMCTFQANLPGDSWSHVAGVYSASKRIMKLYLNGKEVANLDTGDFPPLSLSNVPLRVGGDPDGGNRFLGRIRTVAIYSRALTAAEIEEHAKAGDIVTNSSGTPPGLLGAWRLSSNTEQRPTRIAGTLALRRAATGSGTRFDGQLLGNAPAPQQPLSLWYRKPASQWVEALPIGNGRLGAMVFGGITRERIQLNESTLYAGGPYDPNNPEALAALPEARRLIFEGKYREADRLVNEKMIAKPRGQMPYQTVGDLVLQFPDSESVSDYRRDLDLDTAITRVSYVSQGTTYTREAFASPVENVIVLRLTASKPGKIIFSTSFTSPQKASVSAEKPDSLLLTGMNGEADGIPGQLKFQARVRAVTEGGTITTAEDQLSVSNANSVTLFISAATSYRNYKDISGDPAALTSGFIQAAIKKSYDRLRREHVREHQRLFRRVSLNLGDSQQGQLTTDERIKAFRENEDPHLAALYFQYGRYLLISSSRPGAQPANLQGIWNDSLRPPWGSKYTININTEMNYWPVDLANVGECIQPLESMVKDLTDTGARSARMHWGAGGWVAHHNTDLWRAAAPIDGPWGHWPTGGAWLCQNLWDHFLFTRDQDYLARIYPSMKGAAQFFLDSLVEEPTHKWLVTCPSASPENSTPKRTSICAGPTMDMQIIRDLFSNCIQAGDLLKLDPEFRARLAETRARLAPNQVGKAGQLQEWLEDWDMAAPEIHHRHVSHLYGLYPSAQITARLIPELAAAVRKSLEIRGDDATGWGLGWRLNLWARLLDGPHAYEILKLLLRPDRTYPNMFDAHPPFQIDGNFGGCAGIAEMLVQSHETEKGSSVDAVSAPVIELLPALPPKWQHGQVKGLRARGDFTVDLEWSAGKVTRYHLTSSKPQPVAVRMNGKIERVMSEKQ